MSSSFPIPKGYSAPDGVKEGQEFTEIASFKFDGKEMTLLSVGEDKTPISEKAINQRERKTQSRSSFQPLEIRAEMSKWKTLERSRSNAQHRINSNRRGNNKPHVPFFFFYSRGSSSGSMDLPCFICSSFYNHNH